MADLWVEGDANVLLRFLTGEPPELAERAFFGDRLKYNSSKGDRYFNLQS